MKKGSVYWDDFYKKNHAPSSPSQFAAFIRAELPGYDNVIDFGCGNGRDSFFFAWQGCRVLGIDSSVSAIRSCNKNIRTKKQAARIQFVSCDVSNFDELWKKLDAWPLKKNKTILYARFFLHAIDDESEKNFLGHLSKIKWEGDLKLCIEARTMEDEFHTKVTDLHYRRFIDPNLLVRRIVDFGFSLEYLFQGTGLAKHKEDDACVVRAIFGRN